MNAGRLGTIRSFTGNEIRDRVRLMFGQVYKSLRWPMTRTLAAQMVLEAGCPSQQLVNIPKIKIDECQVAAVFWAVKQNAYYMGDVVNIDTYQSTKRTYELGMVPSPALAAMVLRSAVPQFRQQLRAWLSQDELQLYGAAQPVLDCDDGVIILCSLLGSIGYRVGAKCISDDGTSYGHTYGVVEIPRYAPGPKQIVALDVTEYEAYPGWEPPPAYRKAERIFWYTES